VEQTLMYFGQDVFLYSPTSYFLFVQFRPQINI